MLTITPAMRFVVFDNVIDQIKLENELEYNLHN